MDESVSCLEEWRQGRVLATVSHFKEVAGAIGKRHFKGIVLSDLSRSETFNLWELCCKYLLEFFLDFPAVRSRILRKSIHDSLNLFDL